MSDSTFSNLPLKGSDPAKYADPVELEVTALMAATKAGDRQAFDRLTQTLRGRAFGVARSLVGSHDDALELCQEAFMKTYRARDSFRDGEPFLPWFHRILRNTCFSFLHKHKRVRRQSLSGNADDDRGDWEIEDTGLPLPSQGMEASDVGQAFWEGFRKLSSRDREILGLRHFQELSYREIANALEIPEGTVMSRLFHARRRLREQLKPHLDGALSEWAGSEETSEQKG